MTPDLKCPNCGSIVQSYRNPFPTVDIIIGFSGKIVLIERKNPPLGWALPGGFVDYGETLENAAIREVREETGLKLLSLFQFKAYSDPSRDSRQHNISFVFFAHATGKLKAGDDAKQVSLFDPKNLPKPLCFDHETIINDFLKEKIDFWN